MTSARGGGGRKRPRRVVRRTISNSKQQRCPCYSPPDFCHLPAASRGAGLPLTGGTPRARQASPGRALLSVLAPVHVSKGPGTLFSVGHVIPLPGETTLFLLRFDSFSKKVCGADGPLICWRVTDPTTHPDPIPRAISLPSRAQSGALRWHRTYGYFTMLFLVILIKTFLAE